MVYFALLKQTHSIRSCLLRRLLPLPQMNLVVEGDAVDTLFIPSQQPPSPKCISACEVITMNCPVPLKAIGEVCDIIKETLLMIQQYASIVW